MTDPRKAKAARREQLEREINALAAGLFDGPKPHAPRARAARLRPAASRRRMTDEEFEAAINEAARAAGLFDDPKPRRQRKDAAPSEPSHTRTEERP